MCIDKIQVLTVLMIKTVMHTQYFIVICYMFSQFLSAALMFSILILLGRKFKS